MRFISTRGGSPPVPFRTALFDGLAPDGGLYVAGSPAVDRFRALTGASLIDVGQTIAAHVVGGDLRARRRSIGRLPTALDFPIPLVPLGEGLAVLELFHGPTFAFKDVGARVMAQLMAALHDGDRALTILVATSGDTGSAVAQAFAGLAGTRVVVLFPFGKVTPVQEAQFATIGGNVQAIGVNGTFDDCQRLVKEAFADPGLRSQALLTSANSINIGRLLPQTFYYAHTALTHDARADRVLGAQRQFRQSHGGSDGVAARRADRAGSSPRRRSTTSFPRYLATGRYEPGPSVPTLANAMDVGHPSNVERLRALFDDDLDRMRMMIDASSHTDVEVRQAIRRVWEEFTLRVRSAYRDWLSGSSGPRGRRLRTGCSWPPRIRPSSAKRWNRPSVATCRCRPLSPPLWPGRGSSSASRRRSRRFALYWSNAVCYSLRRADPRPDA